METDLIAGILGHSGLDLEKVNLNEVLASCHPDCHSLYHIQGEKGNEVDSD